MKKLGSVLGRFVLGLVAVVGIIAVGLGLFIQTDHFRTVLRDQLVQTLNTEFQGTFGLERIAGSIWGDLVLHGLSVHYAEREVIAIPRVGVRYALRPFLQGRVEISHIEAFSPIVKITQSDDDSWDVGDAFASRDPALEPSQPSTLAILLSTILLHEAQIELTLADESPQTLHFTQANLDLGLRILPAGLEAEVRQFASQLTAPDVPPLQLAAILAYQDTTTPATLSITTFDARSVTSAVQLTGGIPNFAPPTVDATLELKKLAATDLQPFLPGLTLNTDISGTLQIRGPQTDLATHVMLSAGKAKVTADVQADLSQADPRYTGTVQIAQLDPRKLLGASLPAGIIKGTLQATGVGTSVADLNAQADLHIAALQVDTWQLGNVSLNGSFANKRAKLQGEVHGGLGQAAWDGTLDLLAKPLYELNLSVDQLDLQQVSTSSTGQDALTGQLTLSGRVKGEGFNLPDMNTQVELAIRPSTIGPVRIEQGRLVGTIVHGRIRIADTRLTANDTVLAVSGELGTAIKTRQYNVRIGADLRCEGQISAPHISGRLDVLKATLRPDLAFLTDKPITRDATITVIRSRTLSKLSEADQTAHKPAQANPPLPLTLDLRIQIHRNTRIVHQNASIELAGNVHVTQQTAGKPVLVGSIETVRGWAGFKGRRFTLKKGAIEFTGGTDINPSLDITAQARVPQYTVEARVGGTANEPTLDLSSEPALDQADILAVMLFGKPASQLGQGQQVSLQDQALKITGGYAAARISESVTEALGLEELGIDLRDVDYSGDRVGYGRSLTDQARVSVSQGLT